MSTVTSMPPEAKRRLANLARFWNERLAAAESDAALAQVCFDRARAAARRAQKHGANPKAMHELAELLAAWAERQERAEIRRHGA
ncbi:hypothetical protein [Sphaerisporangium fuscum]|uniref:hypothetical protein n=1 Tax=Sphaerisporangium fuscum TaxID=2835868 RepID=UPI001BDC1316|nr:hypothetical protein [Sphaerisporangium fuscum]